MTAKAAKGYYQKQDLNFNNIIMNPKTLLRNTFKPGSLKLAHSKLPAIPEGRAGYQSPQKLNPPHFADATRDAQLNRIEHKMSIFHLVFVR